MLYAQVSGVWWVQLIGGTALYGYSAGFAMEGDDALR